MITSRLDKIINSNAYTKEWREKTAYCLLALGMSVTATESAITGVLDNRKDCFNVCKAQQLDFHKVWGLLKS